jgi:hypothetical protein
MAEEIVSGAAPGAFRPRTPEDICAKMKAEGVDHG